MENTVFTKENDIKNRGGVRNSNIELFRIITMLVIVAHHYVVNSGLLNLITRENVLAPNSLFLLLFGWGGKTGINCFVIITGYFMCKSQITLKKFLKLLLEVMFYRLLIYAAFLGTGYTAFSLKGFIKTVIPVTVLDTNFTSTYLVFYLFIPFLNILINAMTKKQHTLLIALSLAAYTVLPTFFMSVTIGYVGWFMIIYLIGAYLRLYPDKFTADTKLCAAAAGTSLILSWASVLAGAVLYRFTGIRLFYHFVADSNKILALVSAVSAFAFFKNINIRQSKLINTAAASAFGVLLIHANGNAMRKWLWEDVLKNTGFFGSKYLVLHAVLSVLSIYIICTCIDFLRIKFIEKPFFKHINRFNRLNKYI